MSAIKKLKHLTEKVHSLLEQYPTYRDNDKKLVSHIWMEQLGGIENMRKLNLYEFCKSWIDDPNISSPDSIVRARRKVQENHHNLRGEFYKQRRDEEVCVRRNIKDL